MLNRTGSTVLGFAAAGLLLGACAGDPASLSTTSSSGGAGGTGATTSNTGGGSGTGGNGTGGGLPVACELTDGEAIPASYTNIYVSALAADDKGDGTRDKPFQTLTSALKANAKTIYLCGDATHSITGSATIMKTVALQGGFGCDDWTYHEGTKTKLLGDADKPALTVKGASTQVALYDLAIEAPNAVAEGASAIGVLVSDAHAEFWRVSVKAGKGAVGKRGANGASERAHSGEPGNPGVKACASTSLNSGGIPVPNSVCGSSVGGRGGDSTTVEGGDGSNGKPVSGSDGKGGIGESSVPIGSSWSCTTGSGSIGASGAGATGVGTLTAAGWQGVIGMPGDLGGPGQGGGGGGAAKGSATPVDGSHPQCAGASGGSGGAGGCGGVGGEGGFAGGASLAVVSFNATVVLHATGLITVGGGTGGQGGDGQLGGEGGLAGPGGKTEYAALLAGCKGGDGGPGGNGGGGGGGLGGASVGIAYVGTAPTKDDDVTFDIGAGGDGGAAGAGGTASTPSASGPTGAISEF